MQHLDPVANPHGAPCHHCGGTFSREWGFCDFGDRRYWYGRGSTHNKCREPFARALKSCDAACQDMSLAQIAHWATKHRIWRRPAAPAASPCPTDTLFDAIARAWRHGVTEDELQALVFAVSARTMMTTSGSRSSDRAQFVADYFNWERYKKSPVPPMISTHTLAIHPQSPVETAVVLAQLASS